MTLYITAQIIGFLGYLFLVSAPNFKNQRGIIRTEILACSFLCLQWVLLAQPTLMVLNILNIMVSMLALKIKQPRIMHNITPVLYIVGCGALLLTAQGSTIDMLCIIAFCAVVRAKSSQNIVTFRSFSILAGAAFTICGIIALSIPATLFNIVFILVHTKNILGATAIPSNQLQS
tara:strand:+ start:10104 stop:10628 length:525 start_codon:yes stop_codon:yes gene_type:complete